MQSKLKHIVVVRRRDNKILKERSLLWVDKPCNWYEYCATPDAQTSRVLSGFVEIVQRESKAASNCPAYLSTRESITRMFVRNRTDMRRFAQRYRFKYIMYATTDVTQLVALLFHNKKYELLFRLKYSHHL
jgi:hypothetical protein